MNSTQLLKILTENRTLLQRNHRNAYEHLQMLNKSYTHLHDEEVILSIELNNSIAEVHFNSQYEKAIENSLRIISEYDNSIHKGYVVHHYLILGRCYANTGEFDKAEANLLSALKRIDSVEPLFVGLKTDILHTLVMNEQIAERGPEKSITYMNEALELLKDETSNRKANCLMGLGNVYINADMLALALENYNKAAVIYEYQFDLSNMGNVYCNIGTCYLKMEDFAMAEQYLEKSLELRVKVGSPEHLSISYYNLALVYKAQRKLDRAEDLLLKCMDILIRTDSKPFIKDTEYELAQVAALKKAQEPTLVNAA